MERLFFSIIIPAHNEEHYLGATLEHVQRLDYPAERFEVLVVENGSSDATLEVAKKFEGGNIKILQSEKGVSRAKNLGIDHASKATDWIVFVDADTTLFPSFLSELDAFLRRKGARYAVGTFSVRPSPDSFKARVWFRLYDIGHYLTSTSYSIKAVKRSLFPPVRFDEELVTGEDLNVIQQARTHGKFFFLWTKSVATSTRRFESLGWWYILFYWTFVAVLPLKWQRRFSYEAVR